MFKRNLRRYAAVAGAALALGSMAPAMAARIDLGEAETETEIVLPAIDLTGLLGNLTSLVNVSNIGVLNDLAISDVTAIVSALNGTLNGASILTDVVDVGLGNVTAIVADAVDVVDIDSVNILNDGILNGNQVGGDVLDVDVLDVDVLDDGLLGDVDLLDDGLFGEGGLLGGGLLGLPLGSILNVDADANVNLVAGLLAFL